MDREQFGVHLDLVNLINTPRRYFDSAGVLAELMRVCGDRVVAGHLKDISLQEPAISVIMHEVRAGLGNIDFAALLRTVDRIPREIPLLLEHLPNEIEYDAAARHIRTVARSIDIAL